MRRGAPACPPVAGALTEMAQEPPRTVRRGHSLGGRLGAVAPLLASAAWAREGRLADQAGPNLPASAISSPLARRFSSHDGGCDEPCPNGRSLDDQRCGRKKPWRVEEKLGFIVAYRFTLSFCLSRIQIVSVEMMPVTRISSCFPEKSAMFDKRLSVEQIDFCAVKMRPCGAVREPLSSV